MAGTTEYLVHTTVTATQDVPPRFTGCHTHGSETFCLDSDGGDVEITLASDTVEGDDHDDHDDHDLHVDEEPTSSSTGKNCHFHAGVEYVPQLSMVARTSLIFSPDTVSVKTSLRLARAAARRLTATTTFAFVWVCCLSCWLPARLVSSLPSCWRNSSQRSISPSLSCASLAPALSSRLPSFTYVFPS